MGSRGIQTIAILVEQAKGLLELSDLVVRELLRHSCLRDRSRDRETKRERSANKHKGDERDDESVGDGFLALDGSYNGTSRLPFPQRPLLVLLNLRKRTC